MKPPKMCAHMRFDIFDLVVNEATIVHYPPPLNTRTAGKPPFSYVIISSQNNRRNRNLTKSNRKRNKKEKHQKRKEK